MGRVNIVIEKNRVPHQPDPTKATESFRVPVPSHVSEKKALMLLWQLAMVLDWTTASLSDFPPRCYVSRSGVFCLYLEVTNVIQET